MSKVTEVRYINVDAIHPASFNPKIRTDEKALKSLYVSMQTKGFLPHHPIILVDGNIIADGHRRWTCAKMLNITEIPYILANESLEEVWAENGSQRAVSEKEMMQAMRDGLKVIPDGKQKRVDKVNRFMGEDGIKFLADNNLSPSFVDTAERIAKYCGRKDDRNFIQIAVKWMAEYRNRDEVRYMIRHEIPASVLEEKIVRNEPIRMW